MRDGGRWAAHKGWQVRGERLLHVLGKGRLFLNIWLVTIPADGGWRIPVDIRERPQRSEESRARLIGPQPSLMTHCPALVSPSVMVFTV